MWSTSNIFCPTQKKAHKPQRCDGLNFYPETQQLTVSKKMIHARVICVSVILKY